MLEWKHVEAERLPSAQGLGIRFFEIIKLDYTTAKKTVSRNTSYILKHLTRPMMAGIPTGQAS